MSSRISPLYLWLLAAFAYLGIIMYSSSSFCSPFSTDTHSASTKSNNNPTSSYALQYKDNDINVVYCFDFSATHGYQEVSPIQLLWQSLVTLAHSSRPETKSRLHVFLLLPSNSPDNQQIFPIISSASALLDLRVSRIVVSPEIVRNIKVWGYRTNSHKVWQIKLEAPPNYFRFYLDRILPSYLEKALYLDLDTTVVSDISHTYDSYGNDVPLSAGVQPAETCTAGKIISIDDPRLKSLSLKKDSPCMVSAVMIINLREWRAQNVLQSLEQVMEMNAEKKLYALGSLPPLMIALVDKWEHVPDTVVGDCHNPLVSCKAVDVHPTDATNSEVILHPTKGFTAPGFTNPCNATAWSFNCLKL